MIIKITSFIQALMLLLCAVFPSLTNISERAINMTSNTDISFNAIDCESVKVNSAEKEFCRKWFDENILYAGQNGKKPAYNFTVNVFSLHQTLNQWDFSVSEQSEAGKFYRNGKTSFITVKHKKSGLEARVEATIYEEDASCEWTVYIKNTANENSPKIKKFNAIDTCLETGRDAVLYYSEGSHNSASDFTLKETPISDVKMSFYGAGGRSSDIYMPYFNISGKNLGAVMSVGWSGQWQANLRQSCKNVEISAGQQSFDTYLLPGEEIRSPLVSLSFYKNENAVKGFNVFRSWIINSVMPENVKGMKTLEISGPEHTNTVEDMARQMAGIDGKKLKSIDCLWMDAGWYQYTDWWADGVGNWTPDLSRFPNGIAEVSELGKKYGLGFVQWYEPERFCDGTYIFDVCAKNKNWGVYSTVGQHLFNYAEDGAWRFMAEYISERIKENGVSVYRQDFNVEPLLFWEKADEEYYDGRTGICENHYIANYYKFLDYLFEQNPGLLMDNCASGGRRLDLEMTRRSFPIWRSDYNCDPHDDTNESNQNQTFGISCWLPVFGLVRYTSNEYEIRSSIAPCNLYSMGMIEEIDPGEYKAEEEIMMKSNYFPITYGGTDKTGIQAMQYGDHIKGEAFVFVRENTKENEYFLKLNGLKEDSIYVVYDYDNPNTKYQISGAKLMSEGMKIDTAKKEKAHIIMYDITR